jgi:hypothetical protein
MTLHNYATTHDITKLYFFSQLHIIIQQLMTLNNNTKTPDFT